MEGWTWHLHTTVQNLALGPSHVTSGLWIYISFSVKLEPLLLSHVLKDLSWWSGEIMDVKAFYKLWNIMWTVQHPEQGIIVCIYIIWTRKPLVFLLTLRTLQTHFHFLLSEFLNDFHPQLQDGTPFVWLFCLEQRAKSKLTGDIQIDQVTGGLRPLDAQPGTVKGEQSKENLR